MMYDRKGVAKRIRIRRKEMNMTITEVAKKIGKAIHYYGDIERGTCGMSIETLLDLVQCLDLSADYILFGDAKEEESDTSETVYRLLNGCDEKTKKNAVELMRFYLDMSEKETNAY